jgi:hypothetical protein
MTDYSKRTPGPFSWSAVGDDRNILDGNGYIVASLSPEADKRDPDLRSTIVRRLNAPEAVPEIIEALEELMKMRGECFIPNENDWWDNKARAALAKARGTA